MSTNSYVYEDPPSKRILFLMSTMFARWHSTWYVKYEYTQSLSVHYESYPAIFNNSLHEV